MFFERTVGNEKKGCYQCEKKRLEEKANPWEKGKDLCRSNVQEKGDRKKENRVWRLNNIGKKKVRGHRGEGRKRGGGNLGTTKRKRRQRG